MRFIILTPIANNLLKEIFVIYILSICYCLPKGEDQVKSDALSGFELGSLT